MQTLTDENMIKLAMDTVDLVILRALVADATRPITSINRLELERLARARDLLAECMTESA